MQHLLNSQRSPSIFIYPSLKELSHRASNLITQGMLAGIKVLGLATGSSQIRLYNELVKAYNSRQIDFAGIHTFNLDEYYPMDPSYSLSYRYFMNQHFFNRVNLPCSNINFLDGMCKDPDSECCRYESKIQELGGIDVQVLGIGVNGHIAFCEPSCSINSTTMLVSLTEETLSQNSDGRFFRSYDEVPKHALTMGIQTIMRARKILVLANGPRKARAVHLAIEGPVTTDVPASILQLHSDVTWLLDHESSVNLTGGQP